MSKPPQVARELLSQLAQAKSIARDAMLVAQNAAKDVEILALKIAVRYQLPSGATWDAAGVITYPPRRGDPVADPGP